MLCRQSHILKQKIEIPYSSHRLKAVMMMSYLVQCAAKPHPDCRHQDITHLGGINANGESWYDPMNVVIKSIGNGHNFYVVLDDQKMNLKVIQSEIVRPFLMVSSKGMVNNLNRPYYARQSRAPRNNASHTLLAIGHY